MTAMVLDAATAAKFLAQTNKAELRDEAGRLLGYFDPTSRNGKSKYEGYSIPDYSREELDRRASAPGGRSLAEILADLERRS